MTRRPSPSKNSTAKPDSLYFGEEELSQLLQAFAAKQVLVIGDVMLDQYVEGKVERISPEAPIQVLKITDEKDMAGGAGNVARNLAALGVNVELLGLTGDDSAAARLLETLSAPALQADDKGKAHPLPLKGKIRARLQKLTGFPTIQKTRFVAGQQQLLRTDREIHYSAAAGSTDLIIKEIEPLLKTNKFSALALSDYGKGTLSPALIGQLIALCKAHNLPLILDPKGTDYSIYKGVDYITPNRQELALASQMPVTTDSEIEAACRKLLKQTSAKAIIATRSEQGISIVPQKGDMITIAARAQAVYDVAGAGDTVVAALTAMIASNPQNNVDTLARATAFANLAAGIVVAKPGTALAFPDEILSKGREDMFQAQSNKILTWAGAAQKCENWRQAGLKIGFANGCFDLLHPGHIQLLSKARAQCDRLIVGLNSDASVARLKGPTRPVQSEENRAIVLAALEYVDMVVIFEDDTPLSIIEVLRPDYIIKGADYKKEQVVGADLVESWGGAVKLIQLLDGHSTTSTISKLNQGR